MSLRPSLLIVTALLLGTAAKAASASASPPAALEAGIAGAVFEASGRPVAGARVSIVGTQETTTTDRYGKFRFAEIQGTEVVVAVVAIGFRPFNQRVRVGDTSIRIVVTAMAVNLDAVVVTGTTESVQRKELGNSVATIEVSDALQVAAATSLGALLNGRAPGVTIQPRMGFVGGGPRLKIRGAATFFLGTEPIIYIDGIRADSRASTSNSTMGGRNAEMVSRLNDINSEDIESIEIIRGPAAATLYGTEASNGVVQIITKKGRAGAPEFEISTRQGANWFRDPEGRLPTLYSKNAAGQVVTLNILEREAEAGRKFFQTGNTQGYMGSFRGGTDVLTYYGSAGWDDDEGVEPTNTATRFSSRLNLKVTPNPKFQVDVGLGLSNGSVAIPNSTNLFSMFYADAALLDTPRRGFFSAPPEAFWRNFEFTQDYRRATMSVDASHQTLPWLRQRFKAGLDLTNEDNKSLNQRMSAEDGQFFGLANRLGSIRQERVGARNRTFDYSVGAKANLRSNLSSTTTFGAQYFRRTLQSVTALGSEFPARGVTTVSSAAIRQGFEDFEENATVGVYAQQQLGWNDRLFLTAAVRGDDNSAFGQNYDVIVYPKVGLSWAISDESFWPKSLASRFRVRSAFGASGQQPSTFAAVRSYRPVTAGNGTSSISTGAIGNPDLKPERSRELELGFEGSFLNDRLSLDVSYYAKSTDDALLLLPVPPSLGYVGSRFVNAGEIATSGVEAQVSAQVMETRNVKWSLGLNISNNESEVKSLGGEDFLSQDSQSGFRVGFPVNSYFQRRVASATLDGNGRVQNILCDGGPGASPLPCANAPRVFLGRQTPKIEGAFTSELLLFGRLRFYGMVDFKRGHHLWNADYSVSCRFVPRCRENYFPQEFDAVSLAYVQVLAEDAFSAPYIQDAGFFKLRELSVGYTLPERTARYVGGKRASITVAGRNLAQWGTKYWSFDPESYDEFAQVNPAPFGAGDNLRTSNIDISSLPQLAQFMVTFRVGF